MCFSAQASFIASAILAVIGAAIIRNVKHKKQWWLVAIPFMFSIQQFLEGIVWVTLKQNNTTSILHYISVYGFVFFALVVWPAYIPLALWRAEPNTQRKLLLFARMLVGCCLSLILVFTYINLGVFAYIQNHHIVYTSTAISRINSNVYWLILFIYILVTIGSLCISSLPYMRLIGIIGGISCVVAYIGYNTAFGSVWCFFAAIISCMLYYSVKEWNKLNVHA